MSLNELAQRFLDIYPYDRGFAYGLLRQMENEAIQELQACHCRGNAEQAAAELIEASLLKQIEALAVYDGHNLRRALAWVGNEGTLDVLEFNLVPETDQKYIREWLYAIHLIGGPGAIKIAEKYLQHSDSRVRDAAAYYRQEILVGGTVDMIYGLNGHD